MNTANIPNNLNLAYSEIAANILTSLIQHDKLDKYNIEHVAACYEIIYADVRLMAELKQDDLLRKLTK